MSEDAKVGLMDEATCIQLSYKSGKKMESREEQVLYKFENLTAITAMFILTLLLRH